MSSENSSVEGLSLSQAIDLVLERARLLVASLESQGRSAPAARLRALLDTPVETLLQRLESGKKRDDTLASDVQQGSVWVGDFIDHTLLKPTATKAEVEALVAEAQKHRFTAVCVNGSRVGTVLDFLRSAETSNVKVAAVIGFPLGAATTASKAAETAELIGLGAHEIDMVLNIGLLKDQAYSQVLDDVAGVVQAAGKNCLKVILECGALSSNAEIVDASLLSILAGARFIKTSTGFGFGGAKRSDVELMVTTARCLHEEGGAEEVLVKASGGVRAFQDAIAMVRSGARRIGTSAGVAIATESKTSSPSSAAATTGY